MTRVYASQKRKKLFTDGEMHVMKLIVLGHTNKEIADLRFTSEAAVKYHCTSIFKKLGVKSRYEAMGVIKMRLLHQEHWIIHG